MMICLPVSAKPQTSMEGNIELLIGAIRDSMPGTGSNGFVVPTNTQLNAWGSIFTDLRNGNLGTIQPQVSPFGYLFVRYFNIPTAETLYILKENTPIQRGWGTYIFDRRGLNDLTIEVPHPRYDSNSCIMGIRSFTKLDAQWYFLAGTLRYANPDSSSDMAHVTQSVFHRAHTTAATGRAIQVHGFDKTNPIYLGYPDIVISNGTLSPPAVLYTLEMKYEVRGFTAGVFSTSTYTALSRLGATQNKQGQWSNANGKAFVHIEHDLPIRIDSANMARCIEAMYETFTPSNSVEHEQLRPASCALEQNYPNPFNPATTISYQLSAVSFMSLNVYDMLGREVATLVNQEKLPGRYSVVWYPNGLASGVYLYRMSAVSHVEARRMILVK